MVGGLFVMQDLRNTAISSMEVAQMVDKKHGDLLKDIRRYTVQLGEGKIPSSDFFTESTYQNSQNKTMPCYLVTKKGCEFIAHKLTGQKGIAKALGYAEPRSAISKKVDEEDNGVAKTETLSENTGNFLMIGL